LLVPVYLNLHGYYSFGSVNCEPCVKPEIISREYGHRDPSC
jgi:hypothetical protein